MLSRLITKMNRIEEQKMICLNLIYIAPSCPIRHVENGLGLWIDCGVRFKPRYLGLGFNVNFFCQNQ